jgi:hypothetical protein
VILDNETAQRAELVRREVRGFSEGNRLEPELRERTVAAQVATSPPTS